jgi:hypothetical protein
MFEECVREKEDQCALNLNSGMLGSGVGRCEWLVSMVQRLS